jgi:hypothetical protein
MKTRKLLALVLAIALLASFISVPVFAEGEGEALETLGILVGTGDGVTEEYLATTATRAQAALVNLRLLGLEADALAFDGEATFTDAADATEFWQPVLEYLKATPSVGWVGYEDGSFMPNAPVTGQAFTKVLLVALGYEEGVDFTWATVMDFAATVGLTALADKAAEDLIVEDLAMALVEALGTKTNSPMDITLLTQLVMDGVIDEADAVAAGFEVEEPALVIVDAYASSVKEVTVEMSTDVPSDAVITLKKGTASYSVAKVIDGDMITLTALFNLPAGTYTVTVNGESADFVVMAQHAVDLVIAADTVYLADGQDLKVSLLDQYGDAMSLAGTNYSVFNQSDGYVYSPTVGTTLTIDVLDDTVGTGVKAGQVIYVFVYDPASMLTLSKELPIIAAPYLASLEIGGVTLGKIGTVTQTMLYETTQDSVLDVKAFDQYGHAMTLTPSMFTTAVPYDYTAQVQVLSSNETVLPAASIAITSGKFTFDAGVDGMAMFTFIIPDQALIYTSEMLTVYGTPELDSIVTAGPDEALYADEATDFAVMGYDQYGNAFDVQTTDAVTFTSTVDLFGTAPDVTAKNKIGFTPDMAGSSTVYYFLDGIFQGTFDVSVNPAAYPFQITAVDTYPAMEEGTTHTIMSEDITVIDQYGRTMTAPFDGTGFQWEITTKAATTLFSEGMYYPGYDIEALTGGQTGSATFIATLVDMDGWYTMTESAFTFDVTNVETEDISGFAMAAIDGPMYMGVAPGDFVWGQDVTDYYKYVVVTGVYSGMEVFLLDDNGDDLPDLIDLVTSTNDAVEVMSGSVLVPSAKVDGTTNVKAWKDGVAVAMTDLGLSKAAPDLTEITILKDAVNFAGYATTFEYWDQYGVQWDGVVTVHAVNPDTLLQYVITGNYADLDGTGIYYTVIKWNGLVNNTFFDKDDVTPWVHPS